MDLRLVLDVPNIGSPRITPELDGRSLVDLIGEFETSQGWSPAGRYDGLRLNGYRFGRLGNLFHGRLHGKTGPVPVLGCECGEWGCWPLMAEIDVADDAVTWGGFSQPHRREWDYTAFGPFVLDSAAYDDEVARLVGEATGLPGVKG